MSSARGAGVTVQEGKQRRFVNHKTSDQMHKLYTEYINSGTKYVVHACWHFNDSIGGRFNPRVGQVEMALSRPSLLTVNMIKP